MDETSRIIRPILRFLFPSASEETILTYHGYVRKFAHFAEYSILALLAFRAFSRSFHRFIREYRYLLPLLTVLIIASIDEFIQSLEASRTGTFRDVLLDFSGGIVTVTVLWLIYRSRPNGYQRLLDES